MSCIGVYQHIILSLNHLKQLNPKKIDIPKNSEKTNNFRPNNCNIEKCSTSFLNYHFISLRCKVPVKKRKSFNGHKDNKN